MSFRKVAGGVRGLSPRDKSSAPWHEACGHSALEEELFPTRELGWGLRCSSATPGPFSPPVLAPGSPSQSISGAVWKWGEPDPCLSLELGFWLSEPLPGGPCVSPVSSCPEPPPSCCRGQGQCAFPVLPPARMLVLDVPLCQTVSP